MLIRFVKVSYFGWNPCVMAGIERAPKANVNFLGHMLCLRCSFFFLCTYQNLSGSEDLEV